MEILKILNLLRRLKIRYKAPKWYKMTEKVKTVNESYFCYPILNLMDTLDPPSELMNHPAGDFTLLRVTNRTLFVQSVSIIFY